MQSWRQGNKWNGVGGKKFKKIRNPLLRIPDSCQQQNKIKHPQKDLSCKLKNRKCICPIKQVPVLPVDANNSFSPNQYLIFIPRVLFICCRLCVCSGEQELLSISCQPAGEPLLPVTSSRQPVCRSEQPRRFQRGLLGNTKVMSLLHRKYHQQAPEKR